MVARVDASAQCPRAGCAGAPTGLTATVAGNTLSLAWTAPAGVAPLAYLVQAGTGPGLADLASAQVPATPTALTVPVPNGTYYIRVRAVLATGVSAPSNEVVATVGCVGLPTAPGGFAVSQGPGGNPVQFSWTAPSAPVTAYRLEAGTAPGLANLVTVPLAGSATSFAVQAPPGTYYVRLRAQSACGLSAPSAEVVFTVGSSCVAPSAPTLTASVTGTLVSLNWTTPPGTAPLTYTLAAGSSPGASNLATVPFGQATSFQAPVPPGTYFVRITAANACGSAQSNEVTLVVGAAAGTPNLTFTVTPNPVPYAGFINVGCGGATVPGKTWIYTLRMTNQGTATFVIGSFVARITAPGLAPIDVPYSASTFALAFGGSTIAPQASRQGALCVIGNWEDATLQWTFHHSGGGSFTAPVITFLRP